MVSEASGVRPRALTAIFAVVTLALFMQALDATIVATALHAIQVDLNTTLNWAGWALTSYSFGLVIFLPLAAKFCERFGNKRVFTVAVVLFGTMSLVCGLAGTIGVLIVLRIFQAGVGAGLTPSATGIIVENFGSARDRAIGLFGSVFQVGGIAGPLIGGVVVTYLSWRWIFFINVPVCLFVVVVAGILVPSRAGSVAGRRHLDIRGMAGLTLSLGAIMLGVALFGEPELGERALAAGFIVAGGTGMVWFLHHVRRARDPLVRPNLIFGRGFAAVNLINIVYGGSTVGFLSLVPLYGIERYGMTTIASGSLLTVSAVAGLAFGITGTMTLRRTGYRPPLYANAIIAGLAMVGLAIEPPFHLSPYVWLTILAALIGVGRGGSDPSARNAGIQLMPEQAPAIAAMRTMGRRVGTVMSVGIATTVAAAASSEAAGQAWAFGCFGAVLLLGMVMVRSVPEHRGSW